MRNSFLTTLNNYPWRHLFLCLAPLVVALILFAAIIGTDDELARYFKAVRKSEPTFTFAVQLFTNTANFALYAIYLALLISGIRKKDGLQVKRAIVFAIVQICVAALLVQCIKIIVGSPRPYHALANPDPVPFSLKTFHHSFPSGHTTEIVNSSATLAGWFQRPLFSISLGMLIALVGSSRIYLSQHHLIDIVAGMVLGSLASLLIHFICSREYRYEYFFRQVSR